jgi:hypothetical protein
MSKGTRGMSKGRGKGTGGEWWWFGGVDGWMGG